MSAGPDLSLLSHEQKDALIHTLVAQVAALTARVAELEAKLGLPPKTPDNSSVPPSKGQKASEPSKPRPKANPHAGAHRPLHPNPTRERIVSAHVCQDCGADVSNVAQSAVQVYDRIEIPKRPRITGIALCSLPPSTASSSHCSPTPRRSTTFFSSAKLRIRSLLPRFLWP